MLTTNDLKKILILMSRVTLQAKEAEDYVVLKQRVTMTIMASERLDREVAATPTSDAAPVELVADAAAGADTTKEE